MAVSETAVQTFIDYLKFEKRYSPHTIRSYQDDLAQFFNYLDLQFGSLKIEEISSAFVRSWLASLMEDGNVPKTIHRKVSSLKSFFKFHIRGGLIQQTPMSNVSTPKLGKRLPVFIKEEDTQVLLDSLKQTSEDWKSLNARMLIVMFYSTGMRLSELIQLQEKQIDFGKFQIKVLGKGNKERIIPMNKTVIDIIEEYLILKKKEFEKTDGFFLVTEKGKKMYPKYAYLLVNRFLTDSVKTLDKKSPHVLRHTFATHLTNNGADLNAVKELLGHSSLASTQVYTHNTIGKLKEVYKKAHPKA